MSARPRPSAAAIRARFAPAGILAALALPAQAEMVLRPHDVLAIAGDSITYQRAYTTLLEDYFLMCQPVEGLRVAQFGSAGETASGFAEHMADDALRYRPTVLLTLFGMNDGRYLPLDQPHEDGYRAGQAAIIAQARRAGVRTIVLGSPTCVDPATYHTATSTAEVYNAALTRYGEIGRGIAGQDHQGGLVFADVNARFMEVMTRGKAADPGFVMCGDGVHPLNDGHLTTAYAFLKALGCDGAIGAITLDLATGAATGTPGQRIASAQGGAISVESTRYPFCFWGKPGDWNTTLGVLPFLPFNQELNRYLLVVKGLAAPRATVTWGTRSKVFAAADLAAGINLAAEFLDNPFVEQFRKVDKAVHDQQDQEDVLLHGLLFRLKDLERSIPGEEAAFERLVEQGIAQDAALGRAAAGLVVPVVHAIRVEPSR